MQSTERKFVRMIPGSRDDHVWRTCPDSDPDDRAAVVEKLFDLRSDPGERTDLAGRRSEEIAEWARRLDAFLKQQEIEARNSDAEDVLLDEATKERLRALGYAQP